MKDVAVHEPGRALPEVARISLVAWMRRRAAGFWLQLLFFCTRRMPRLVRWGKPLFVWGAMRFSHQMQRATAANARRILPADLSDAECFEFGKRVTGNFYDFIADVGRAMRMTPAQMFAQVTAVEGEDEYRAVRAAKRGAIVVTAHMGSFEVGLAALRQMEERVHVVFRRDQADRFDPIRRALRQRLGVIENPVDDGFGLWVRLRDALIANDVVVIQGDRVMPGQRGQRVPFLGSHVALPTGPVKLAQASGAPLIPIFALRQPDGKIRIRIEKAIEVAADAHPIDGVHPAMLELAAVLEKQVREHPDQWLMLEPAFCEDVLAPADGRRA